ncbi:phosphatase PAP2 family protein [Kushneria phyllosphaerae]|uniref:undecaprenyl-diphosphate phosphatase n=1 Tax=Kushneria phyllosphaerae TaxID=2100822 RepID=A0A2R8CIA6_9GAMM|nr:phosphatase PAP2 family protein [Kushneria phyllosphaerae]SPJ32637.1 Undecaprenyl-diphosphatase BcrC [Kushneria phyllosphaerae]
MIRESLVALTALALLVLTTLITFVMPLGMEDRIMLGINQMARESALFDFVMNVLSYQNLISGVVLVAGFWALWFMPSLMPRRAELLACTVAAFGSAALSRIMQQLTPAHPRPLQDQTLNMTPPTGIDAQTLHDFSSFPSDHAAVYIGLAYVIWRLHRKLGLVAIAFATLLCFTRIYLGFHFITDIIGGGALAILTVQVALLPPFQRIGAWFAGFSQTAPHWFYPLAFIACYGIATLVEELRELVGGLLRVMF